MPTSSVSIEKYEGQVAWSPERSAFVPSSPSCAARPGARTIHMKSATPKGPIEKCDQGEPRHLRAPQFEELSGHHLTEHLPLPSGEPHEVRFEILLRRDKVVKIETGANQDARNLSTVIETVEETDGALCSPLD